MDSPTEPTEPTEPCFKVGDLVDYRFDDFSTYRAKVVEEPYKDFGDPTKPWRYPILVEYARKGFGPNKDQPSLDDPRVGRVWNIQEWQLHEVSVVDQLAKLAPDNEQHISD